MSLLFHTCFPGEKTLKTQLQAKETLPGLFEWTLKYQAIIPLLVSEDLFHKVQRVLESHNQGASRKRKHSYLLRGYLFCLSCSKQMWAEPQKKETYHFYYCKHCGKGTYKNTTEIENQVEKLFSEIQLSDSYVENTIKKAQDLLKQSRDIEESRKRTLIDQKSGIEKAMR